ncbi:hypothetical protein D9757_008944 [Collybiopsis confluens]|uniref:Flavin-containing monooxygenase n=1 Tax=Collybiopsis confluens TaxID=2823264 RepID=A0A8H5HFD6_9AGAR|nr:hypothetical protein D9757_008944 [Collybiopsis confluens]
MPTFPGASQFKGEILHSTAYSSPKKYAGKKAIVVGAGVSGHDVSADLCGNGTGTGDVTMYQRGSTLIVTTNTFLQVFFKGLYDEDGPPTEVADLISFSYPLAFMAELGKRQTLDCEKLDQELLEGLKKRGFKLDRGLGDAGVFLNAWGKRGGHYIDVGASQLIVDGKIKLKTGSAIERFTPTGLKFEDGTELEADVVVFATGIRGDIRQAIGNICGEKVEKACKPVWGFDEELEVNGTWRDLGVANLWYMCGGLAYSRFYSLGLALRAYIVFVHVGYRVAYMNTLKEIKAIEEGIFDRKERYSLPDSPNDV